MCRTSIYEARNNFSALVKCAEEGEVVELTRYDKPVAVMMSYSEYEERKAGKVDWLTKWREEQINEIHMLKIVIPDNLKGVYEKLNKMGKADKA